MVAAAISAALVTALSWAWWPHPGNYQPIEPGEREHPHHRHAGAADGAAEPAGALARAAAEIPALPVPRVRVRRRRTGSRTADPLVAAFQKGDALPTKDAPALALVLVPTGDRRGPDGPSR